MGISESIDKQCLLLGPPKHGKTWFLYHNVANELESSKGFNYEIVEHNDVKIGLWDLAATPIYKHMWKKFYMNLNIQGVIYIIRKFTKPQYLNQLDDLNLSYNEANDEKQISEDAILVEARKDLHYTMNEHYLKDAFCFVIFNDELGAAKITAAIKAGEIPGNKEKPPEQTKIDSFESFKQIIKFDELPQKNKDVFHMTDIKGDYHDCMDRLVAFFKDRK